MSGQILRTLVIGGARSGKSHHASQLAIAAEREIILIATARASDKEMEARIARHRAERAGSWRTVEEPINLRSAVAKWCLPQRIVVVDCLTLWLSNLMEQGASIEQERLKFIDELRAARGPVVLVSNEVGLGLVPMSELGRRFRDEQGLLNQAVAHVCEQVTFMAAGLTISLKSPPPGATSI